MPTTNENNTTASATPEKIAPEPMPLGDSIEEITEGRTIWNSDGTEGPCLICPPPRMRRAQTEPPPGFHAPEAAPTNALAAKVAATNRANHAVVLLQRYVAQQLKPFIGLKVLKNSSWGTELTKKAREAIGEIKCDRPGEHFSFDTRGAWISVRLTVSRCYKDDRRESSMSYEAYASVGRTEGDILTELCEPPKLRTDYTEAEIRGKRAVLVSLKDQVRKAESNLEGFGEYER